MERRELFGSLASFHKEEKKQEEFIRPPYYSDLSLFHNECNKCDAACATACEEDIIAIASDKTPYLLFLKNGCTYCDKCAEACEFGVLTLEAKSKIAATVTINKERCLSWDHTMCFSCKDPCLENAIDFKAMFMPQINDKCTACGFCISRCPTDAIEIKVLS